jgi:hypothetical protein
MAAFLSTMVRHILLTPGDWLKGLSVDLWSS